MITRLESKSKHKIQGTMLVDVLSKLHYVFPKKF